MKATLTEETKETNEIVSETPEESSLALTGNEDIVGDFDSSDLTFPTLSIAQGVGPLADDWEKGDMVIDGEFKLDSPAELTVLRVNKRFVENIPYGADETPRVLNSKEDVLAAGGTTSWDDGPPSFKAVADCLVCIHGPSKASQIEFPFELGKNRYLFAMWRIKGASYKHAAKTIIQAAKMYYRNTLREGTFFLNPTKEVNNGNSYIVAKLVRGSMNDAKFISWLGEFA